MARTKIKERRIRAKGLENLDQESLSKKELDIFEETMKNLIKAPPVENKDLKSQ